MKFPEYMKMLTEAKNDYDFSEKVDADLKKIGIVAKNSDNSGKYKDFFGYRKVGKTLYVNPTEDEDVVEILIGDNGNGKETFDRTELNVSEFSKLKAFLKDVEEFVEAEDKFVKSWLSL
jgi:hypothetical protein